MDIGDVVVKLRAEAAEFASGLTKAEDSLKGLQKQFDETGAKAKALGTDTAGGVKAANDSLLKAGTDLMKMGGVVTASTAAIAGLGIAAGTSFGKYAESIILLSQQTGFSTDAVQKFNVAFNRVNLSVDALLPGFKKLSTVWVGAMGEIDAAAKKGVEAQGKNLDKLAEFGIKAEELKGMNTEELFLRIAEGASKIENPMARAKALFDIFARSSVPLARVFQGGRQAFEDAGVAAQRMGAVMSEDTLRAGNALDDQIDDLNISIQMFSNTLGATLEGPLKDFSKMLTDTIGAFNTWWQGLDAGTKSIVTIFAGTFALTGPIMVIVGAFMAAVALGFAPLLVGGLLVAGVAAGAKYIVDNQGKLRDALIALWEGLKGWAIVSWTGLKVAIVTAAQQAYEGVKQWMVDKLSAVFEPLQAKLEAVKGWFRSLTDSVVTHSSIPDLVNGISSHMGKLDQAMVKPATDAVQKTTQAFNKTGAALDGLGRNLGTLYSAVTDGDVPLSQLAATVAGIGTNTSQMIAGITAMVPQIQAAWTALTAIVAANPFTAVALAVVAIAAAVYFNWDRIKQVTAGTWTVVQSVTEYAWTALKTGVVQSAKDIYNGIKQWFVDKLNAIVEPVRNVTNTIHGLFVDLKEKLVGHSVVPETVESIGRHMEQLDLRMGAPARIATTNTLLAFKGMGLGIQQVMGEIVSVTVSAWGNVTNAFSNALATNIVMGNNWAQTWQSIAIQVLSSYLNMAIQMATQWSIMMAKTLLTTTSTETAKTAVMSAEETARVGIMKASQAVITSSMIANLGALMALGQGGVMIMSAVMLQASAAMAMIGGALAEGVVTAELAIPVIAASGQLAMGAGILTAAGTAAIQAAAGAAIVAMGATALAQGGVVTAPTFAMLGEKGPEAVIPLNRGGGGRLTVEVPVYLNRREIARAVADDLPSAWYGMGVGR